MNMMSIIFSNAHDDFAIEFTGNRTLASLPIYGRYRLIDFALSNLVNSDVTNVGIITKENYQSLLDHVGSGKSWDLDRKSDGLFILPPFGMSRESVYTGKLEALNRVRDYLMRSLNDYVVIMDSNVICNIDYRPILQEHIDAGADITVIARREVPNTISAESIVLYADKEGRMYDCLINIMSPNIELCGLGMYIISRKLLIKLVDEAAAKGRRDWERDIIQRMSGDLNIHVHEFSGYSYRIDSLNTYFNANMDMLDSNLRDILFDSKRPIYTKVRDSFPVLYGEHAKVKNSLIADGCVIDGEVENSILFRGVKVSAGTVIRNSIIMQDCVLGKNVSLDYVITDKNVMIRDGRRLVGDISNPIPIKKNKVI